MASLLRVVRSAAPLWVLPLAVAACGGGSSDGGGTGGSGGAGGSAGSTATSLVFEPDETLLLVPSEARELTVLASPPGVYVVRFALLGDDRDATLDTSEAQTDSHGAAHVLLTAPTSATTFKVSAAIGDSVATSLSVSVSASGFGTLQVHPSYTGKRKVLYWSSSARTGTTCAGLAGKLLEDGDLVGTSPVSQVPQIDGVPVGPPLAVTIRGAYSVVGCKDVLDARAGEIVPVTVPVSDLPMKLDETSLQVKLGLDSGGNDYAALFDAQAVSDALGSDDGVALLGAMQAAAGDAGAQSDFQAARKSGGWDAAIDPILGGPDAIREKIQPWLVQGLGTLPSEQTFLGKLVPSTSPGYAWLSLSSIGGVDPKLIGIEPSNLVSWSAEADDTVQLGATFLFLPSRVSTALALGPAKAAAPGASSVPEALAELLGCDQIATALVSLGSGPGQSYAGCDAACTEQLCVKAMESLWRQLSDTSAAPGAPTGKWVISATGAASVDDHARPQSFAGKWVGSLVVGPKAADVGGSASGGTPPPPG
jgi:hypothetical protein